MKKRASRRTSTRSRRRRRFVKSPKPISRKVSGAEIPNGPRASARKGSLIQVDGKKPYVLRKGPGCPKHGEEVGPSSVCLVRVPDALWHELKVRAKRQGTTVHAELRAAIAKLLRAS